MFDLWLNATIHGGAFASRSAALTAYWAHVLSGKCAMVELYEVPQTADGGARTEIRRWVHPNCSHLMPALNA